MIGALKVFWLVTRNSLIAELEYRFNYFMWSLSSGISLVMESAILVVTMSGRTELGGFRREDLWRFVFAGVVLRNCTNQWKVVGEAVEEVREGAFRKYLLQPIHYPSYFIARSLGDKLTITSLFAGGLFIYKICVWQSPFLSFPYPFLFAFSFAIAAILTWQVYLFMIYLAFWIDEVQFLQIAFNIAMGIFSGTLLPFSWLPEGIRRIVGYTPFRYMGDWPIQSALGHITLAEWAFQGTKALMWVALMMAALAFLGQQGRKRYEAYGG